MKQPRRYGNIKVLIGSEVDLVEPFAEEYNAHAAYKKIPLEALQKMDPPMNLIKIAPVKADFLNSDFKKDGFDSRQHFVF